MPPLFLHRIRHRLLQLHRARILLLSKGVGTALARLGQQATAEPGNYPWVPPVRIDPVAPAPQPRRLLWIDEHLPDPQQDSGSLRMYNLMRLLVDMGHRVHCLAISRRVPERLANALNDIGVGLPAQLDHARGGSAAEWFLANGAQYDAVILSRYHLALPWLPLIKRTHPQIRTILDTVDLHHVRETREARARESAALAAAARVTRRMELSAIRQADIAWVVSEAEAELVRAESPANTIHVVSNLHGLPAQVAPASCRRGIVFVGGAQHPPNADALRWLLTEIAPKLRSRVPDCPLHLVGKGLEKTARGLPRADGIQFHGLLPDLEPLLGQCRVGIAPLRFGAGVKGKINQYMAHGLPVVATQLAIEGMQLHPGHDVLAADDAEGFTAAIERLHEYDALWTQLSLNGRDNVRRHFSTEAIVPALRATFEDPPLAGI